MVRSENRIVFSAIAVFVALAGIGASIRGLLFDEPPVFHYGVAALIVEEHDAELVRVTPTSWCARDAVADLPGQHRGITSQKLLGQDPVDEIHCRPHRVGQRGQPGRDTDAVSHRHRSLRPGVGVGVVLIGSHVSLLSQSVHTSPEVERSNHIEEP